MNESKPPNSDAEKRAVIETFLAFLRLGCTSFGGPVAHLGAFQREFVLRRRWLDEASYADLVSLCQFLPGPASSQVGIALGLGRAGLPGALAAFLGFTLPSACLLFAFAAFASQNSSTLLNPWIHGLKVVAVALVAHALIGMRRTLVPDAPRLAIALVAALLSLSPVLLKNTLGPEVSAWRLTLAAPLAVGLFSGLFFLRKDPRGAEETGVTTKKTAEPSHLRRGKASLIAFIALLVFTPLLARVFPSVETSLVAGFTQAGSFVFGGGHVVLPFLHTLVVSPGWVTNDHFLAAYGAAQAVPGPLFTVATALGAFAHGTASPLVGATLATLGIFLPAFLLVCGALPFWEHLRRSSHAQGILQGVNASVFGLLIATFCAPISTSGVQSITDAVLATLCFVALVWGKVPTLAVVAVSFLIGGLLF
ncbi:MAG: chromate efflux transporter [Silvanigrellales bacterium]|nr:chromate efflux transporter [Silvanigrellales bacterium]